MATQSDINSAQTTVNFLRENQDYIKLRGKNITSPKRTQLFDIVYNKYIAKKYSIDMPSHPKKIPDNMVDTLLQYMYEYDYESLESAKKNSS